MPFSSLQDADATNLPPQSHKYFQTPTNPNIQDTGQNHKVNILVIFTNQCVNSCGDSVCLVSMLTDVIYR